MRVRPAAHRPSRRDAALWLWVDGQFPKFIQSEHATNLEVGARIRRSGNAIRTDGRRRAGERDVSELAKLAGSSENLVADALHQLREKELLAAEPALMESTVPGISRREAISRAARYGAAAAGASLIVSATAATPAMASSGEKPKECEGKAGNHSCCLCKDGTCITSATIIDVESCEKECETHGGDVHYVREGVCV
jgi:hypothetical protein